MNFDELQARCAELQQHHQSCCDDVNGPCGTGESSPEARDRDRTWGELCEVEAAIETLLAAERAGEESAA